MKKIGWLLVVVVLVIVAVGAYFLVTGPGTDFKRIRLLSDSRESIDEPLLKEKGLDFYRFKGAHYFKEGSTTFKGKLIVLEGDKKRITIEPRLKGSLRLFLEANVKTERQVKINIYKNRSELIQETFSRDGVYLLRTPVRLEGDEKVDIFLKGRGTVILGDPIFYREKPAPEREYIFLICADTLRADHLSTYGYGRKTSPRIDEFSKDCVVFENAYAQAPWTLPSHMSLFTALYEFNHGVKRGTIIPEEIPYLVEELSDKFLTRSLNGGIYISSRFGFFRGFDFYHSNSNDQVSALATEILVKKAIEDLNKLDAPRIFYFLHTYQTHSPYNPLPKNLHLFNKNPRYRALSAPTVGSLHREQYARLSPEMVQAFIDLYDAEIVALDAALGKFIDYLKKKNIYRNSMIILMSDHGEEFFDHQGWGHCHSLYNELIHIPLVVKFPGLKFKGRRVKREVGLIDLMPTILDYYGVEYPRENLDGLDLVPFIEGQGKKRALLSTLTSGYYIKVLPFKISLVENHEKTIYKLPYSEKALAFFDPPPPPYNKYEFYDLARDPGEQLNLYLRNMKKVKDFKKLFDAIVSRGELNIKSKGKKAIIDKQLIEAFKSLGYL